MEVENREGNPPAGSAGTTARRGYHEEAVAKSPQGLPVRHLEAATAAEESLLLALGLSPLPGGRQFVPQAERRHRIFPFREGDGRGRTFDQTPGNHRPVREGPENEPRTGVKKSKAQVGRLDTQQRQRMEEALRGPVQGQPGAAADWLEGNGGPPPPGRGGSCEPAAAGGPWKPPGGTARAENGDGAGWPMPRRA